MFDFDRWREIFQSISKNKLRSVMSGFTVAFAIILFTLHSKFTGDSFTLDGVIRSDSTSVKPAFLNSLTFASKSHEERDTC